MVVDIYTFIFKKYSWALFLDISELLEEYLIFGVCFSETWVTFSLMADFFPSTE